MFKIKNWNETFENADTRKRVRLGWFHCPSGVDSQGYIELMSHGEAGIKAFGVFLAICQWSATCLPPIRGSLARSDGRPLLPRQVASLIRMPVEEVERAFALLASPEIGWICKEKCESADDLPPPCHPSAGDVPQGQGKGQGQGEGKGQGKVSCTEASESPSVPESEFDPSSCRFPTFPCAGDVKTWEATATQLEDWQATYPAANVAIEHRRAHAWVMSHLSQRKTVKGYPKFMVAWLSKCQDRQVPAIFTPATKTRNYT
jgi:hypothetical protein